MNGSLHSVFKQIAAKCIPIIDTDYILVPDTASASAELRLDYQRIIDLRIIYRSQTGPLRILLIHMRQLDHQLSGFDRVKPTVKAFIYVVVLSHTAIITDGAHCFRQIGVMRDKCAGIAQRADVFCRIKTEAPGMTQRATPVCSEKSRHACPGTDSLRIVLNYKQLMFFYKITQPLVPANAAIKMHRHYRLYTLFPIFFKATGIHIQRLHRGIGKHRLKAIVGDGQYGSHVSICGHHHLVSVFQPSELDITAQGKPQGVKSVGKPY